MKIKFNKKMILTGIIAFLVIAASICFYYLVFRGDKISEKISSLFKILSPVIYGIIIAYLLTPIVNFIEQKLLVHLFTKKNPVITPKKMKYMRMLSVILTMLVVLLLLYAFFSVIVPEISKSIVSISNQFPYYIANLTAWSTKFLEDNPTLNDLFLQFVQNYSSQFDVFLDETVVPYVQTLLKHISLSLINVLVAMWNFIIGAIISIYVLFNKELFAGQAKKIVYAVFNTQRANSFIKDVRFASGTFIGFIIGKIVDSTIIGILCFIGLTFLKMPYALLVSVIVGVTNVIPFFGPYLGAIPSALLILLVNPLKCLYFLIFIIILQQLDGNVIGPKILGQSTGLSGFWVIFSITIFGGLWGVAGMIVGVPLWAVIYAMVKRIVGRMLKRKGLPSETKQYLNVDKIENNAFVMIDKTAKKPKRIKSLDHMEEGSNATEANKEETNDTQTYEAETDEASCIEHVEVIEEIKIIEEQGEKET